MFRQPSPSAPRGIAMLLVLICVATASVLAASYLASRDNSSMIGHNVASAASARWASSSAVQMSLAVLETESAWREDHVDGRLFANLLFNDIPVSVDLLDLQTGAPPTLTSEHIQITATATGRAGIMRSVAIATVPAGEPELVDLDLSEFAAFARDELRLAGDATIARWPTAPLSAMGQPLAIGVRSTAASAIQIEGNAAAIDARVYHSPGASDALVVHGNADGDALSLIELPDALPLATAPHHGAPDPLVPGTAFDIISQSIAVFSSVRLGTVTVDDAGVLTLQGDIDFVVDETLTMANDARLRIDGNVTIVAFGDVTLDHSAIELEDGASLRLHVGGNLLVQHSYCGERRSDDVIDHTGYEERINPERLRISGFDFGAAADAWTFSGTTAVKAALYAPDAIVALAEESALYGCVCAAQIEVADSASIFYDPWLNRQRGYTNLDGSLYGADGHLHPPIADLAGLDPVIIQTLADDTGTVVMPMMLGDATVYPSDYEMADPVDLPGLPTPRPVPVALRMQQTGPAVSEWERHAAVVPGGEL